MRERERERERKREKERIFLNLPKIKQITKNFCPPILWSFLSNLKNKTLKYRSLYNLDKKIESYVNFNNGYFVELGANDGITFSNTYYFEKYRGWRGILIEPVPHNYLKCLENRSKETQVFCNACVSFQYKEKFVEIIYSDMMSTSLGLETDINNPENHSLIAKQFLKKDENNFNFGAIANQLNNILLKADAPKQIDFLSLDVEGTEIEVLKGINHNEYRFKFICIESRDIQKMTNYLSINNYLLIEQLSPNDYLFKDKN
jgi:FkbM family methyltransferase